MQTEDILEKIWTLIQTFEGVDFTSTVKTKAVQDREFAVNFKITHLASTPLLDRAGDHTDEIPDP